MKVTTSSITVRSETTSTEIAVFLQQASKSMSRRDVGLRARHGVGKDGAGDGTVVLYVRQMSRPESLQGWIAFFIDNVKAVFNAKKEYELAARTLLQQAQVVGSREMAIEDGTKLCSGIARVIDGKDMRLGLDAMREGWEAAFSMQARIGSSFVLNGLKKDIGSFKGLPETSRQKGQTPRKIIETGIRDLAYIQALLYSPLQQLGEAEKMHVHELSSFLDIKLVEESAFDIGQNIANLIRVALPREALCPDSVGGQQYISDAIRFAREWLEKCEAKPVIHAALSYSHVRAIDYLSGRILSAYLPKDVCEAEAQALIVHPTPKNSGKLYSSISQAMDAKLKDWIDKGKPPSEFFEQHSPEMQWRIEEEAE